MVVFSRTILSEIFPSLKARERVSDRTRKMLRNLPAALVFLAVAANGAFAQSSSNSQGADVPPPATSQRPEQTNLGSPEDELLQRARIRHEEESHKELRERADEAAQLGLELRKTFESRQGFTREDLKKLERVEKLARRIRSGIGGSGDDAQHENLPAGIEGAVAQLAALTDELNQAVKKTSRLVVSGAVIERSNRLIGLIRHMRSLLPR
jgi:flagellar basal body-associated protein FliL